MYVNWLILCCLVVRPSVCARPQEDVPRRPNVEQCLWRLRILTGEFVCKRRQTSPNSMRST